MNKSYYAIIPANVRYDKRLTANAKLLYGEITALCNEKGYCWARNSYFAELYGVSKTSISKWINQLIEYEYLFSEIKYRNGSKEIEARYLKIIDTPVTEDCTPIEEKLKGYERKVNDPIKEKLKGGIKEKLKDNNTSLNTTVNTKFNNIYDENFEKLWKLLKSHPNDRKSKVSNKRKKELYEIGYERVEKAINLYLKIQNPEYYHKRDNILNEIINNYIDKTESDFDIPSKKQTSYDIKEYEDNWDEWFQGGADNKEGA